VSVSVPQPFRTHVVTAQPFRTRVEGIPTIPDSYSFAVTALPTINTAVQSLPTIRLSVDNLPPVRFEVAPLELRLTEFPSVRTHLPADFAVGFSLWGVEIGAIRLCGEAQVITEPYRANPCEACGPASIQRADHTPAVTPAAKPAETARQPANPARPG
jgi:hypothetical protein